MRDVLLRLFALGLALSLPAFTGCMDSGPIDNDPDGPPVIEAPPPSSVQESPARPKSPRPQPAPGAE